MRTRPASASRVLELKARTISPSFKKRFDVHMSVIVYVGACRTEEGVGFLGVGVTVESYLVWVLGAQLRCSGEITPLKI